MNNDDVLDKIRKCLALAASDNPHEAAAALRQAQKLMTAHDVSDADLAASGVRERRVKAGAASRPPTWERFLAAIVREAFHCRLIFSPAFASATGSWAFVGVGADPEIAGYAFDVLLRQVKKSRAQYIRTKLKRCKNTQTKTKRADTFCLGYMEALAGKVAAFAQPNPHEAAIATYFARKYPNIEIKKHKQQSRALGTRDLSDLIAGSIAGDDAQLFRAAPNARQPAGFIGND